jgi:hypothetical protein
MAPPITTPATVGVGVEGLAGGAAGEIPSLPAGAAVLVAEAPDGGGSIVAAGTLEATQQIDATQAASRNIRDIVRPFHAATDSSVISSGSVLQRTYALKKNKPPSRHR